MARCTAFARRLGLVLLELARGASHAVATIAAAALFEELPLVALLARGALGLPRALCHLEGACWAGAALSLRGG